MFNCNGSQGSGVFLWHGVPRKRVSYASSDATTVSMPQTFEILTLFPELLYARFLIAQLASQSPARGRLPCVPSLLLRQPRWVDATGLRNLDPVTGHNVTHKFKWDVDDFSDNTFTRSDIHFQEWASALSGSRSPTLCHASDNHKRLFYHFFSHPEIIFPIFLESLSTHCEDYRSRMNLLWIQGFINRWWDGVFSMRPRWFALEFF